MMTKISKIALTFSFLLFSNILFAQNTTIITPKVALPYTRWEMRIIEIGPTRDFYGSTTHLTIYDHSRISYRRSVNIIRGKLEYDQNPNQGEMILFNLPYTYSIRNNILYYQHQGKEIALLKRIFGVEDAIENENKVEEKDDAILSWLMQNAKNPEADKKDMPLEKTANNTSIKKSHWQLIDFSNTHLITSLAKELNWKPKSDITFTFLDNGEILLAGTVEAEGKWTIGDQHIATIILSYTDTGWNRVIGKDRLIKLELKTPDGTKNLFHIMSDDARSLYPVTIRRMGDENPSYAYVNRTHVFSQLEKLENQDTKNPTEK